VDELVEDEEKESEVPSDAPGASQDNLEPDEEDDEEDDGFAIEDKEEEELLRSTRSGHRVKAQNRYIEAAY
jgi:hypothetical protein